MKRTTLPVSLSLGLGMVVIGAAPLLAQNSKANDIVPGEIVVGIRADRDMPKTTTGLSALTDTVGTAVSRNASLHSYHIRLQPGVSVSSAIAHYQKRNDVVFAEPNHIYRTNASPNDPKYGSQYGPRKIQADTAWPLWQPKAQIVVAVIDTGVDYTHPDLKNKIFRDVNNNVIGVNTTGSNAHSGKAADPADDFGHGTHCAGVVAAQINNGVGVAGIAGWDGAAGSSDAGFIKVMPVKVLDSKGQGTDITVADGITWATDHGARVISMSLSGGGSTYLSNAIAYAWSHGVLIVAAAGNSSSSVKEYPAGDANVLSVASTDSTDSLSFFSNFGSWVTCTAPGSGIYSTVPTYTTTGGFGMNYSTSSGTSMATPHVAGEAALILAQYPSLTNAQLFNVITTNVDAYKPYNGNAIKAGGGRINVYKALVAAGGSNSNVPPTVSITSPSNGAHFTAPATVTINATAGDSDGTVTKVEFYTGSTLLGSDTTAPYSFNWNNVPAGSYALTAVATDDQGAMKTSTAVNITVNAVNVAPTVSITSPSDGATSTAPTSITIDASASDSDGTVSKVDFYAGTTLLGSDTTAPYSIHWNNVPVGSYSLTAVATDNQGATTTSTTVDITVNPANVAPTVNITNPTNNDSFTGPASVTIDANAVDSDGTVTKVEFYSGTTLLGSDSKAPYSFTWTNVPAGSYTLTAVATDDQGATTTSTSVDITVNSPSSAVAVSGVKLNPTTVVGAQSSTATVTLAKAAPAGGQVVNLTSSNTSAATVPATITVPAGQTSVTFPVATSPVAATVNVSISATSSGMTKTAALQVRVPYLDSFTLAPATLVGGNGTSGTVNLIAPAGPGGVVVKISGIVAGLSGLPSSVTVPAGATSATFPLTTSKVLSIAIGILTAKASSSRTVTLTITP